MKWDGGREGLEGVVWCGVVWCGMALYGMVWCGVVWYGMVWFGMVWYGVVWYDMVWYGVVWCAKACQVQCQVQRRSNGQGVPMAKACGLAMMSGMMGRGQSA